MFSQIINMIEQIISLFSDSKKLSIERNRIKIGKRLVEIHQSVTRITENATSIEVNLQRFCNPRSEFEMEGILRLPELFYTQKNELKRLQEILKKEQSLVEIYGDNYLNNLTQLISGKVSLVDITSVILSDLQESMRYGKNVKYIERSSSSSYLIFENPESNHRVLLPKTLDLMKTPEFRKSYERNQKNLEGQREGRDGYVYYDYADLFYLENSLDLWLYELQYPNRTKLAINDLNKDLIEHASFLLKQILVFKSSQRLLQAKDSLSLMIRSYFKVEELF